jgi:hypothetical protein
MAKGGLDPGADQTIVAAAYRAGMGHVPGDYSKTFQGIATGYSKAMDKMGAGLAKAAEVGTSIAAPLIEKSIADYKTKHSRPEDISEEYGQSFIESIYGVNGEGGFLNELAKEHDLWKKGINEDGSTMTPAQKKEAKRKWKQKRDNGFAHIRQLQRGEFLNTSLIAEGDWNPEATGSENALLHSALQMKGKPLPEGHPYAGVYVKSVIGKDGKISLELTKDGKSISGLNDDGSLRYGDALSTMAPKKKETSGALSTSKPDKSKTKEIQRQLQNQGYDISYTNKQGKVISGEDAIDGDWGKSTQNAWNKFKKDQEEKGQVMTGGFGPGSVVEKPLTVTAENIENLIIPKDYKMRENLTKIDLNELNNGIKGFDFRENDVRRQIGEQIKTSAQLKDAMHAPLANMDGTYADYLGQPNKWTQEMYSVLENMSGIQDIGEPGIDADDFAGEQGAANMAVLRKEMLNANNPTSKKMFIDWYTEGVRESHQKQKAKFDLNQRKTNKGTGTYRSNTRTKSVKSVFNNEMYYKDIDGNTMQGGPLNKIISAMRSETGIDGWIRQEDGSFKKGNQTISGQQLLETIGDQIGMSLVTMGDYFDEFNTTVGASGTETSVDASVDASVEEEAPQTNLDYVVDNIWEPNNVEDFGAGRNGHALFNYLHENNLRDDVISVEEGEGIPMNHTQENRVIQIGDYFVGYKGEYVYLYKETEGAFRGEQPENKYELYKKWGGDSTGGRGYDKDDIMEIFQTLGIDDHLTQNR